MVALIIYGILSLLLGIVMFIYTYLNDMPYLGNFITIKNKALRIIIKTIAAICCAPAYLIYLILLMGWLTVVVIYLDTIKIDEGDL